MGKIADLEVGLITDGQYLKRVADTLVGGTPSGAGGAAWGEITGTLVNQTDLDGALGGKAAVGHNHDSSYAALGHGHAQLHDRQHSIIAAADHAFPGGGTTFLRDDGVFASPPVGGNPVYTVLPNGTIVMDFGTNDVVKVTPTATATYTTTVPAAGKEKVLIILTSGTTSRTITFGSGFKPTATLATGTTTARVFVIKWVSDGANLYESSRTIAMAA